MPKRIKLMNLIGGSKKPRYKRIFHDWSFAVLDNAVLTVEKWINNKIKDPIPRLLTIDVVVPTYRVQMQYLEPIIRLKRSNTASTSIIFIVDNPKATKN